MINSTVSSNGKQSFSNGRKRYYYYTSYSKYIILGFEPELVCKNYMGLKFHSWIDVLVEIRTNRQASLPVTCQKLLSGQKKPASPNPKPLRCFNKSNNHKNIFSTNRNHPTGSIPKIIYILSINL